MVSDELKDRLKLAYADFCSKAPADQQARVKAMLQKAHQQTCDACARPEGARIDYPELAHAWGMLSDDETPPAAFSVEGLAAEALVLKDGSILGFGKYELLDLGWSEAVIEWLAHLFDKATFGTDPPRDPIPSMPESTTIALAGDWGAETTWPPTKKIADLIKHLINDHAPDFTIHLGDVYYVGTKPAEASQLVDSWPRGSIASFALNSNHEMYDGGFGLFDVAYKEAFNQNPNTGQPTHTSYFALENQHWILVGLDSAYYASELDMYMTGKLNQGQIDWLKQVADQAGDRKIIVLSHHPGLPETGSPQETLWSQVRGALSSAGPAYWYWGHIHEAIVYNAQDGVLGRCAGHGSIPYGAASELVGPQQEGVVDWYETKLANDPDVPMRVLNGFVHLRLDGPILTEEFIGENGETRWQRASGSRG